MLLILQSLDSKFEIGAEHSVEDDLRRIPNSIVG